MNSPSVSRLEIAQKGGNARSLNINPTLPISQIWPDQQQDDAKISNAYGPNPQTRQTQGIVIPKIYGQLKILGNIIQAETEFNMNTSPPQGRVRFIVALCRGPIEDIEDIKLNDQPIARFRDTGSDFRLGEVNQTALAGFTDTDTEYLLDDVTGLVADVNVPTTITTSGSDMDGLVVNVGFPNGQYTIDNDGAYQGLHITYTVEIKKSEDPDIPDSWTSLSDSPWTSVGNGSGAIINSHSTCKSGVNLITLVRGKHYDIRVTRTDPPMQNNFKTGEKMVIQGYHEIVWGSHQFPRTAMVGVSAFETAQLSGMPKFSALVTGSIVQCYTGSSWVCQYSNNPAWVVADILNQPIISNAPRSVLRYDGEPLATIDSTSFKAFADYCDVLVPNGDCLYTFKDPTTCKYAGSGTTCDKKYSTCRDTYANQTNFGNLGKRFEFNGTFDTSGPAWNAAQKVAAMARGLLYKKGQTYYIAINQAASPVALVTPGNYIAGSFKETLYSVASRASEFDCTILNQDKDYASESFSFFNASASNLNKASFDAFGITNTGQLFRAVQFQLQTNLLIRRSITFQMGSDALNFGVGDVIDFCAELPQWGYGGRIVAASASSVTLDRSVYIGSSSVISIRLSDDTLITKTVTNTPGTTASVLTISGTFSVIPSQYDLFAFGQTGLEAKPFRGISIKKSSDLIHDIEAVEYNASLYNVDTMDPVLPTPNYSSLSVYSQLSNLILSEMTQSHPEQGGLVRAIQGSFSVADPVIYDHAEIWLRSFENWVSYFTDVPPSYYAYGYIQKLKKNDITTATHTTGFNPDNPLYRADAIIYIIRALYGETFSYTAEPYFTDVPVDHYAFKYIQKAKDLGITTAVGTFNPGNVADRQTMAVFIIRSQYGASFDYTSTPYFSDVTSGHPYFSYIQKFKDLGFTTASAATGFNPSNIVNRADGAIFIVRAYYGEYTAHGVTSTPWQNIGLTVEASFKTNILLYPGQTYEIGIVGVSRAGQKVPLLDSDNFSTVLKTPTAFITLSTTGAAVSRLANKYLGEIRNDGYINPPSDPNNIGTLDYIVTGLQIFNQGNDINFVGKDCHFVWNRFSLSGTLKGAGLEQYGAGSSSPDILFKDYEVEVYNSSGTLLRKEHVLTPEYFYTYEHNYSDNSGVPVRTFEIRVRVTDQLGNQSKTPSKLTVSNASPAALAAPTITPTNNGIIIDFLPSTEPDVAGYLVYASQTPSFTPGPSNLINDGPDTHVVYPTTLTSGVWYAVVAAYDTFGKTGLNYSNHVGTDSTAPAVPSGFAVAAGLKRVIISCTRNTEADFAGYEVYVDSSNPPTTLFYKGPDNILGYDAYPATTYYVRMRAFDYSGNYSAYTSVSSATTLQVGSADIQAGAVTSDKVTTGELITLSAQIKNAIITNAHISDLSADKLNAGTITARYYQTAASPYERFLINPTGAVLEMYDSSNRQTFVLNNSGGTAQMYLKAYGKNTAYFEAESGYIALGGNGINSYGGYFTSTNGIGLYGSGGSGTGIYAYGKSEAQGVFRSQGVDGLTSQVLIMANVLTITVTGGLITGFTHN